MEINLQHHEQKKDFIFATMWVSECLKIVLIKCLVISLCWKSCYFISRSFSSPLSVYACVGAILLSSIQGAKIICVM